MRKIRKRVFAAVLAAALLFTMPGMSAVAVAEDAQTEDIPESVEVQAEGDAAEETEAETEAIQEPEAETSDMDQPETGDDDTGDTEADEKEPAEEEIVPDQKEDAKECTCGTLCTEDSINGECPVCGVEDADLSCCVGEKTENSSEENKEDAEQEDAGAQDAGTNLCAHHKEHTQDCGYSRASEDGEGSPCTYECHICPIEDLIAALPDEVTEDNAKEVRGQLDKILTLYRKLTAEEQEQIDISHCLELQEALDGANIPALVDTFSGLTIDTVGGSVTQDENKQIVLSGGGTYTISGTWTDELTGAASGSEKYAILVKANGTYDITLSNTTIETSRLYKGAFSIEAGASVNLTLTGENKLTSGEYCAGLHVPQRASLTIGGDGKLSSTGGMAGIGGGHYETNGTITIKSGEIEASSNSSGAGIGAGYTYNAYQNIVGDEIRIEGGTIAATGGEASAGIGGGYTGVNAPITITGGTITATGGRDGAGIGAGGGSSSTTSTSDIFIGGTAQVTANGGSSARGIGAGYLGAAGSITIDGSADVTANGIGHSVAKASTQSGMLVVSGSARIESTSDIVIGNFTCNDSPWVESTGIRVNSTNSRNGGIVFVGNAGTVYGSQTITKDYELASGMTLEVPSGASLTIPFGINLTGDGTLSGSGTFKMGNITADMISVPGNWSYTGEDLSEQIKGAVSLSGGAMICGQTFYADTTGWELSVTKVSDLKYTVTYTHTGGQPVSKDVTIAQAQTTLSGVAAYKADGTTLANTFGADETFVVKATTAFPANNEIMVADFTEPTGKQMALYVNGVQVSAPVSAGADGKYTMTASASDVLTLGRVEPNGAAITLTVRFVGDSSMADAVAAVDVNISASMKVEIDDDITYYGTIDAAWAAATANGVTSAEITLLADVTATSLLSVSTNDNITLNGGKHTLTINAGLTVIGDMTITGGTFRIMGNGRIGCPSGVASLLLNYGTENTPHYAYFDEAGKPIALTEGQTSLTGTVTVQECKHDASVCKYQPLDGGTSHKKTCLACGMTWEAEPHALGADNKCANCEMSLVASVQIGSITTYYGDIVPAWNVANGSTATITLLADAEIDNALTLTGGGNITVRGGEYRITSKDIVFAVVRGKLAIESGTFSGDTVTIMTVGSASVGTCLKNYGDNNTSEHYAYFDEAGKPIALNEEQTELSGTVTVKECKHIASVCEYQPLDDGTSHKKTCLACGMTWNAESHTLGVGSKCAQCEAELVAQVNDACYSDIKAAWGAACKADAATLTLLRDAETGDMLYVNSGDITFDGGNYTLKSTNPSLAVNVDGGTLTVVSGTISGGYIGVNITDGALVVKGGKIEASDHEGINVAGGTAIISGGEVRGSSFGVNRTATGELIISGGTFYSLSNGNAVNVIRGAVSEVLLNYGDAGAETHYAFYRDGKPYKLPDSGTLPGGTFTVQQCKEPLAYIHTSGTTKHTQFCQYCGDTKAETDCSFTWTGTVGKCGCGAALKVTVSGTDKLTYDGTAKEPGVTVTLDGTALNASEYTVVYDSNVNAGNNTASVIVSGANWKYTQKFVIQKAPLTITASDQVITYGQSIAQETDKVAVAGLCSGDGLSGITLTASTENVPGGNIIPFSAVIKNSNGQDVTGNYQITYVKGALTINKTDAKIETAPSGKTGLIYNGAAQELVGAGTANVGDVVYSLTETGPYSKAISTGINAGSYTVWYRVEDTSNYNGTEPVSVDVSIDKAVISPQTGTLYVQNNREQSYQYDLTQLLPALDNGKSYGTVRYTLEENAVDISEDYYTGGTGITGTILTLPIQKAEAEDGTEIGTVSVTISSQNYEGMTAVINVISVDKFPVTITGVSVAEREYNGKAVECTGTPRAVDSGGNTVTIDSEDYQYTWQTADGKDLNEAPKDAGSYLLIVSVDNDTYIGSSTISFVIDKASITITANSMTADKGNGKPALTYTISGLAEGEALAVEPTLTCNADMNTAGRYPITASGAAVPDTGNYHTEITYVPGALTVTVSTSGGSSGSSGGGNSGGSGGNNSGNGSGSENNGAGGQGSSGDNGAGNTTPGVPALPAVTDTNPGTDTETIRPGTGNTAKSGTGAGQESGTAKEEKPGSGVPFIKGEDGKIGWNVIWTEEEKAEEGSVINVDMNGTAVVPGDIFDSIKGRDITITFDMGNGIIWSVDGKSITRDASRDKADDIDFTVRTGGSAVPVEIVNNVTGEHYSIQLSLAHDGEFGFNAVLSVNLGEENAGYLASLYYYNEDTGELELICADEVAQDGTVSFAFTHASDYVIVVDRVVEEERGIEEAAQMEGTDSAQTQDRTDGNGGAVMESPKEGQSRSRNLTGLIAAGIIALAGIGAGIVVAVKKKKEKEE